MLKSLNLKIFPKVFWFLLIYILGISWYLLNCPLFLILIFITLSSYFCYKYKNLIYYITLILIFLLSVYRINFINNKYKKFKLYNKNIKSADVINLEETNGKIFKNIIDLKINNNYLRIYAKEKPNLNIGTKIKLYNISTAKFDSNFTKTNNLSGVAFTNNLQYKVIKTNYFYCYFFNFKNKIIENLKSKLSLDSYNLFCTIFLGKKLNNKNLDKIKQKFKNWGISHFLARSGLHIMLIFFILSIFIKLLPLSFRIKKIITLIIIIIYYLFSWSSLSFLRSLFLLLFSNYLFLRNIYSYPLSILSFIAFLFLIYNPFYLIRLDFQLTFCTTLGLIIFYEINKRKIIS